VTTIRKIRKQKKASDLLHRAWCHLAHQSDLLRSNQQWDSNMDARQLLSILRWKVISEIGQ
jgi:hypothetical protein